MSLPAQQSPTSPPPRIVVGLGCRAVLDQIQAETAEYDEAVTAARRKRRQPPSPDRLPTASSARWVTWASHELTRSGVPSWVRDADLVAGYRDLVGPVLERLRTWPEFASWSDQGIEIRWTTRTVLERGLVARGGGGPDPYTETLAGRVRLVPVVDRLTWPGGGRPPAFRLELALGWWLLASDEQVERGLHAVIAACGMYGSEPAIFRPDISAHASTLARYGVSTLGQAKAVFHAERHPDHSRLLREHGFDAITGQGQLWPAARPAKQQDLVEAIRQAPRRQPPQLVELETDRPSLFDDPGEA